MPMARGTCAKSALKMHRLASIVNVRPRDPDCLFFRHREGDRKVGKILKENLE